MLPRPRLLTLPLPLPLDHYVIVDRQAREVDDVASGDLFRNSKDSGRDSDCVTVGCLPHRASAPSFSVSALFTASLIAAALAVALTAASLTAATAALTAATLIAAALTAASLTAATAALTAATLTAAAATATLTATALAAASTRVCRLRLTVANSSDSLSHSSLRTCPATRAR